VAAHTIVSAVGHQSLARPPSLNQARSHHRASRGPQRNPCPNLFVARKARPCSPEPLVPLSLKSFGFSPGAWQGAACRGLPRRRLPREIPGRPMKQEAGHRDVPEDLRLGWRLASKPRALAVGLR
jgi:hypothetical protein